jgi:FKBP-type peptidyl-prolyl cis-trans isomerase FkpA
MQIKHALLILAVGAVAGCNSDVLGAGTPSNPAAESFAGSLGVDIGTFARTESGVYYKDLRLGSGDAAVEPTDQVTVTYAGYLRDGTLFATQSSPVQISLAAQIQGFRDGMVGMRVGGVRKLVIPSALAYSWQGRRDGAVEIPRNATLVFDIELFAITKPTTTTP